MKIWICHSGSGVAHLFRLVNPQTSMCGKDFEASPDKGRAFDCYCRRCLKASRTTTPTPLLNIYLISQDKVLGWDTYDSAVVVAASEEDARKIYPSENLEFGYRWWDREYQSGAWVTHPDQVEVELLGAATKDQKAGTVVCSSFNAG